MPVMDGLSALALLQQCGFNNPIYALTANAMSHEIENYIALGFTGYLSKPIDKKVFYSTLANQLTKTNVQSIGESKVDMTDLTQSFITSFNQEVELLGLHLDQSDYKALQQDSHRILGAAQMFSVHDIIEPALNLDKALLNNSDKCEVTSLTHMLINALDAYALK